MEETNTMGKAKNQTSRRSAMRVVMIRDATRVEVDQLLKIGNASSREAVQLMTAEILYWVAVEEVNSSYLKGYT